MALRALAQLGDDSRRELCQAIVTGDWDQVAAAIGPVKPHDQGALRYNALESLRLIGDKESLEVLRRARLLGSRSGAYDTREGELMQLSYEVSEDVYWRVRDGVALGRAARTQIAAHEGERRCHSETIPDTTTSTRCSASMPTAANAPTTRRASAGACRGRSSTRARLEQPSHVFLFSHGWKGDVDAATRSVQPLDQGDARSGRRSAAPCQAPFKPLWIGLHWPSLPFGDEELGGDVVRGRGGQSPDEIMATYLERLGLGADAEPLLRTIVDAHQKDAAATELPPEVRGRLQRAGPARSATPPRGPAPRRTPTARRFDPDAGVRRGQRRSTAAPTSAGAAGSSAACSGRCASCPTGR